MNLIDLFSKNITEGLRDPADNPCWKGYHPVGTKKKNGRTVPNCVPNANEDVAEGSDKYGFHTSVSKGKFLPSKYGQNDNNLYLHDLMNVSGDGSGPQLVTIDDKRSATEIAAMYGGYVERTGMGTYRVYQPRGARQTTKRPEQQDVAEATGNPGMPHDFTAVQPGVEVWYKGRFAGWTTGKVYDDPYGKSGKMVAFEPNPSEFPGDEGRVLSLPYSEVSLRKSTSIGKLKGPEQGVAEELDPQDPVAAFLARGGEIQRGKLHKPRKGERWQGSSHIGAAGGQGTKGRVSGLGANTNPKSGKPVVSAEAADADQKIGDRYDPDEFDAMVSRLKKLAGAGPLKTVWDPQRRVYRNVPVAQQPKPQPKQ